MTNTEVVAQILDLFREYFIFLLPVIGVLAGITFMVTFLMSVTVGMGRRTFKG